MAVNALPTTNPSERQAKQKHNLPNTMAIHTDPSTLAEEAIDEYLAAAKACVDSRKPDGGILGYPATLLLFCVVNALGNVLRNVDVTIEGKKQRITRGEPFRVLNHSILKQSLTHEQIKRIEHAYRNPLIHSALLLPQVGLTPDPSAPAIDFAGGEVWVSVPRLWELVTAAWKEFDRSKISEAIKTFHLSD
jgi:hypothetical protein